jgi:kynurenine formamidase
MAQLVIDNIEYRFDLSAPIDISITLNFNGPQPNAYGVEPATSTPCAAGDLVGDTRQGGSCNFEQYTFIPHCNGTHTECVGHITNERIAIRDCLTDAFVPALLRSVVPEKAVVSGELYSMPFGDDDLVITKANLERSLSVADAPSALIVRTLPNDHGKLSRRYVDVIPPFFTTEAIEYIVECGVRHLLVDLPSIDRLYDEGRLSNHRVFWNVDQGKFDANEHTRVNATVTELIYAPDQATDGRYLLNLQSPAFASDAAPSRPILFAVIEN